MEQTFKSAITSIENLYKNTFSNVIIERINGVCSLIEQINHIYSNYLNQIKHIKNINTNVVELFNAHGKYLDAIQELNKNSYLLAEEFNSEKLLTDFFEKRNRLLWQLPRRIKATEDENNRKQLPTDGKLLKSVKWIKRIRFKLKSLFKRKKSHVTITKKIPLRYYLFNEMYLKTFPQIWQQYQHIIQLEIELLQFYDSSFTKINNNIWPVDDFMLQEHEVIIDEVINKCASTLQDLNSLKKEVNNSITNILTSKVQGVSNYYYKLGTIEGVSIKNSKWYTLKKINKLSIYQKKQLISWEISLFSISEDWCFDADLFILKNKSFIALQSSTLNISLERITYIKEKLNDYIKQTNNAYKKTYEGINNNLSNIDIISTQSEQISKLFSSDDLYLSKVEYSKTILYAINAIEQRIILDIENTNDKRMIFDGNEGWDKMQLSKLNSVNLKDLIKFEIQPRFSAGIEVLKQNVLQQIALYESEISNIVHVSEYNFETITSIIENKDTNLKDESTLSIIEDGKEKVIDKLKSILNNLNELHNHVDTSLTTCITQLTNELTALTENEKVGELNLRLLKAKAISKSSKIKDFVLLHLSNIYKKGNVYFIKILKKSFKFSKRLVKIYSQEEVQASINHEISTFLSEIANTTNKLPFLYQRLFKLDPVDGGYLYFKRSAEIKNLKLAYNNWIKGRFANIAITAEKGAGITSMINYTLKDNNLPFTRINFRDYDKIYRQDEFIFILSEILDLTPLNEVDLFIDELNNTKGIIVLEGLQYAYLKKVDGFETLKLLFEIISKTNKNIFWICSCTLHAWNYLNKAISIEEYFGHTIKLGEFSNEEMIDIVKKRHQVSGYGLVYLKSKVDIQNKKLSKLSQNESQIYLEKQYFQVLNSIAKGNISVAFIFWLRSIKRIENNTLFINSMSDFNISFIRELKQEKLFCLYSILLHDGLELDDFCKVMRLSPEQGRMKLFQMVDDGLLLEINKRYVINLLLYRSTIDALKAKNILH